MLEKIYNKLKTHKWPIIILYVALMLIFLPPMALIMTHLKGAQGVSLPAFLEIVSYYYANWFKCFINVWAPQNLVNFITLIQYYTFIYIALVIFLIVKTNDKNAYDGIEHGAAHWAKNGEQYKILSRDSGILLADKNYLPLDKPGNVNITVVGGSGAGKSSSFVIPNVLGLYGSYVFTDPKGELYKDTSEFFRKNGYEVKVLNLIEPKHSDSFNPLWNITEENKELDIDIIANIIIRGQGSKPTGGDDYWDTMSEMLLKSMIYFLYEGAEKSERSLASCANLVRMASSNGSFNILKELIYALPDQNSLARKLYDSVELASDKAYSSILSTLQSRLGKFDAYDIASLTATNTIDFEEIGKKKTALYVMSSDTHGAYQFLLTIFFSQLIQKLYALADSNPSGALDVPVYFFLDEFANIGQLPDFDKKIATSRSRRLSFSVILQTLDQLEAIYDKTYETILSNCDTHLFLGSNSTKTAEYFSKALGNTTLRYESVSTSRASEPGKRDNETKSIQLISRPLMTAEEIRLLPPEKCIIIEKGIQPVLADKYYYFKNPESMRKLGSKKASIKDYNPIRPSWRAYSLEMDNIKESPTRELDSKHIDQDFDNLFSQEEAAILGEKPNIQEEQVGIKLGENINKIVNKKGQTSFKGKIVDNLTQINKFEDIEEYDDQKDIDEEKRKQEIEKKFENLLNNL